MSSGMLVISLLNGLSYGLLLFLLSSGLTLIFGMMRVLNLAHGSFYMLGAYLGYTVTCVLEISFCWALLMVPCMVGVVGFAAEKYLIRKVHARGHLAELLLTYGVALVILALVQLVWGKSPVAYVIPASLQGSAFELFGFYFPRYRAAIMLVALCVLVGMWGAFRFTFLGTLLKAATQNPMMLESLGFNVPRLMAGVFGAGCALAALAGMLGGFAYVTEPAMAQSMGMLLFVVIVVGGIGSLRGALVASLLLGVIQTFAVSWDAKLVDVLERIGISKQADVPYDSILNLSLAQFAPLLPFVLMVLILLLRPQGLFGQAQGLRQ